MWSAMNLENSDLDFVYDDADTHANEMAELYCYSEDQEMVDNRTAFQDLMTSWSLSAKWADLSPDQQGRVISSLSEEMELLDERRRWRSIQSLFYLMQGTFGECETIDQSFRTARSNVMNIYSAGLFPILVQELLWEIEISAAAAQVSGTICSANL